MAKLIMTPMAATVLLAGLAAGCIGQKAGAQDCPTTGAAGAQKPGAQTGAAVKKCPNGVRPAADGMIDDLEDDNNQINKLDVRDGYWFKAADKLGSTIGPDDLKPADEGANGSKKSRYVVVSTVGGGDDAWGANLGANFINTKGALYDGSKYAGVSFWGKVGPKSGKTVRFQVGDVNTHEDTGVCKACWNHFGKDVTFTTEWKQYQVLFSEMKQREGWGDPRPASITPDKLYSFDFSFIDKGRKFELWIDDIQFLECK
jgi:hypothetical protein